MFAIASENSCKHCGLPSPAGNSFCCQGCEQVHTLLTEKGLSHFYELREQYNFSKPVAVKTENTEFWDEEGLPVNGTARFFIEGIHCLGCLWLLEKLPEIDPRIASAHLDMRHQILTIKLQNGVEAKWKEFTKLIASLGYSARPLDRDNAQDLRKNDFRKQLSRIGVAAFSAGNIMLLSVSVYAGADFYWSSRFGWISFALALPTLTYSAWPLYKTAFLPLLKKKISVDLGIALAVISGAGLSCWSLIKGQTQNVYFDSITALIFLLLSSRFFLHRFRESIFQESALLSFLSTERYKVLHPEPETVSASGISIGDLLLVNPGQTVPVDAILESDLAYLDLSLLTGESTPIKALKRDRLEAGAKVAGEGITIKALLPATESRLARILKQIRAFELGRSRSVAFADRIGRFYVLVVLALAAFILLMLPSEEGVRRALALTIVTCPCVLAFAVPLALTKAMQMAARRGILFAAPEKIEELAEVRNLFLDKTGTLTNGQFQVLRWEQVSGEKEQSLEILKTLEMRSRHPVGKALARFSASAAGSIEARVEEIPGYGVRGWIQDVEWSVGQSKEDSSNNNIVALRKNGETQARIHLGDAPRENSRELLKELGDLGLSPAILSGDREDRVAVLARELGIESWRSGLLPEEKAKIVSQTSHSAMVGDGANDAIAFRGAAVGIAVQGSVDLCLKNADIALTNPGLSGLLEAVKTSRKTMKIIRGNFVVSLAYNIIAGILALTGNMAPLWAAILMPLSALSVFTLTQWRSRSNP